MSTAVQRRRGTAAQHATFTGLMSEFTHDTTNKAIRVHDGATPGGNRTLMQSELGAANGVASLDASGQVPAAQLGNALNTLSAIVGTRTALKAIDTTKVTAAYLREGGREGQFLWLTGDYSTQIAADTQEGLYVKASAVAATSGGWVRVYQGDINAKWFGAVGDGVAADNVAIQAAVDMCGFLGGGYALLPRGNFKIGAAITISKNFVKVRGTGLFSTQVSPSTAGMDAFIFYSGSSGTEMKNNQLEDFAILPSAAINRAVLIRNHYGFLAQNVSVWGTHAIGFEFENGTVAYNGTLRDCAANNSTNAGLLLGDNGTGDLQNISLYNCQFSGGYAGIGALARNCGGLQWVGGETLNKSIGFSISPNVSGKRVNGVRASVVYFDTCSNQCLNVTVVAGARVADVIFTNSHFNGSQNDCGAVVSGLSSDATLMDTIKFVACNFEVNKKAGIFTSYCQKIDITACGVISNGQDGVSAGIEISGGSSRVKILGGNSGSGAGFAASQIYGVRMAAGSTGTIIDGIDLNGNVTSPISDSGTGTIIKNCPGFVTFAKGAGTFPAAATTFTVNHGLSVTPAKEDVVLNWVSDTQGPRVWVSAVSATTFTLTSSAAMPSGWFFGWQVGVKGS